MNKDLESSLRELNDFTKKMQDYIGNIDDSVDINALLSEHGLDMDELEKSFMTDTSKIQLPYKKLNPNAVDPKYNYDGDSGFDLYSTEEVVIGGLGRALIPTGLSFDIKDGYEIQVRSKSGLAINQGLMCLNSPGTVDNSYTGEVKVILFNTNKEPITIKQGMKVAQAVFCPVVNGRWIEPVEKKELTEKDRGSNGFGSTKLF
jgi:dUTP pyrophosphatase